MSIFKGRLSSSNLFTVNDDVRGLELIGVGDGIPTYHVFSTGHATDARYFYWTDNSGNFRQHTSAPTSTTVDSGGSVIAGSANAGAARDLSNLTAATAIVQDLNIADDKNVVWGGSSDVTMDWKAGGGFYIDFAAANSMIHFGNTNASDITFHGGTATSDAGWCASDDTFQICDDAILQIGGSAINTLTDGFQLYFDGATLDLDAVTAEDIFRIGENTSTDVQIMGANDDIHFDASADMLRFFDTLIVGWGTGDSNDYDICITSSSAPTMHFLQAVAGQGDIVFGVDDAGIDVTFFSDTASDYMKWDANAQNLATTALGALLFEDSFIRFQGGNNFDLAIAGNELVLDATDAATAQFVFGTSGTHGLNVEFQSITAGDLITFDAGAKTLTFVDVSPVMADDDLMLFGSAAGGDISVAWQNSGSTLDICQVTDGTGVVDFIDLPVKITGADSAGTLLTLASLDATGNSDTQVITHTGTGSAIKITGADTDHTALIELIGAAAQTTPYLWLDGDTAGWTGADVTGMLHISDDTVHAHIGASMLYVDGAGQAKASAQGHLARFVQTGAAQADAVMVEIAAKDKTEYGLDVSAGLVDINDWMFAGGYHYHVQDVTATDAGLALSDKYGFYTCDQTTGDDGDIVVLPAGLQGMMIWIYNDDAAKDFVIDGNGAETINGGANITLGQLTTAWLVCVADGVWVAQEIAANGTLSTGA